MKLFKTITIISICILILARCSEDEESYTQYPEPDWIVESPESLPSSFTAIVALPENINIYFAEDDKVAAFIADECRGVGTLVKSEDGEKCVYFLTIRASNTENGEIVFKYYNSRLSYLYQATQSVAFEIDGTFGTFDNPIVLDLEYL